MSRCSHLLSGSLQICTSPQCISTRFSASFILLKESSALFFVCLQSSVCVCVWSGEYDVSSAALCPWVMEQRAICLSGRPSVRTLRSYQCVSPANEKLAGTPLQPLKWMTSLRGGGCRAHLAPPSLFFSVSFPF